MPQTSKAHPKALAAPRSLRSWPARGDRPRQESHHGKALSESSCTPRAPQLPYTSALDFRAQNRLDLSTIGHHPGSAILLPFRLESMKESYRLLLRSGLRQRQSQKRFPRAAGGIREDKSAEDTTSVPEVRSMFAKQSGAKWRIALSGHPKPANGGHLKTGQ
jgi:hypothetical protein